MGQIEFEHHPDMDPDIRLAIDIVYRQRKNLTYQESLSIAWEALVDAKERHDPDKGKLSTYLHWTVKKALNGHDDINLSVVRFPKVRKNAKKNISYSCGGITPCDIPSVSDDHDHGSTEWMCRLVNDVLMDILSPKHAYITYAYMSGHTGLKEIGSHVGMSRQRVHQIANRSAEKIRDRIKDIVDMS